MSGEDRQFTAVGIGLGLLLGVPIIVGLALLFAAAWLWVLGIPGGHDMLFGWLSTKHYNSAGRPIWHANRLAPSYVVGVVSAYVVYQAIELAALGFRVFKDALA